MAGLGILKKKLMNSKGILPPKKPKGKEYLPPTFQDTPSILNPRIFQEFNLDLHTFEDTIFRF